MKKLDRILYLGLSIAPLKSVYIILHNSFHGAGIVNKDISPNHRVLDVGCGIGVNCFALADKGCEVVGLEPGEKAVEKLSKKKYAGKGKVSFVCAGAEDMPFDDESFDRIIMNCVLHHIPIGKQQAALREISRVLKEDGFFYLVEPCKDSLFDYWWDKIFYNDSFYGYLDIEGDFEEKKKGSVRIMKFSKKGLSKAKIKRGKEKGKRKGMMQP